VLQAVSGVLSGHPVSKSWQHRFLGPWLVSLLGSDAGPLAALEAFTSLALPAANVLLYELLKRRGVAWQLSLLGVVGFALAHVTSSYRLEYPWDGIDVLVFMGFGYWAARGATLRRCSPLLAVDLLNHETVLYIPFWYLLAPLEPSSQAPRTRVRAWLEALLSCGVLVGAIALLREMFYRGPPPIQPDQTLETQTPLISNHLHVAHNLRMLFVEDWQNGKWRIAASVLALLGLLVAAIAHRRHVRASIWTLCVFATIVCFGYVNETRHYLLLIAFWFAYAWPP